ENVEVDPPRRLVQTFRALWSDNVKAEGHSRVTWEIEPVGDSCRLTATHDQLRAGTNAELYGGWPMILSGHKTRSDAVRRALMDLGPRFAKRVFLLAGTYGIVVLLPQYLIEWGLDLPAP